MSAVHRAIRPESEVLLAKARSSDLAGMRPDTLEECAMKILQ
jgi:hypothetical protein